MTLVASVTQITLSLQHPHHLRHPRHLQHPRHHAKGGHSGQKSQFLAPQDIPDISGYQLGFGCQCVKAYNNENPVTNQKIL